MVEWNVVVKTTESSHEDGVIDSVSIPDSARGVNTELLVGTPDIVKVTYLVPAED